jgi:hypothetical protein
MKEGLMKNMTQPNPIQFTKDEIEQARKGNHGPMEKRIKKEQQARARIFAIPQGPLPEGKVKELFRKAF